MGAVSVCSHQPGLLTALYNPHHCWYTLLFDGAKPSFCDAEKWMFLFFEIRFGHL